MAKELKVEIVKRETIKPSSPTPDHLRKYNLSLLDQFVHKIYVSLLLFYPANIDNDKANGHEKYPKKIDNISDCLKSSLSKTLTRFYPFAGRFKDGTLIECNDEGAVFVEARVDRHMSDVLKQPDFSILRKFLDGDDDSKEAIRGPLLHVQTNFFQCGGLLIGLRMSHELTDASTMGLFIKAWSATALNSNDTTGFADFSMASTLPAMDPASVPHHYESWEGNFGMKRYVIDASNMALLKAKAISEGVKQPSRVECVSSLLWKCAVAASRSRFAVERPSIFMQPVNMRERIVPPLPENSIGNILTLSIADIEETKIHLQGLITNIRRGVEEASETAANMFKAGDEVVTLAFEIAKEIENLIKSDDTDFYMSTSWCRFPFYETDFGWGKPTWVSPIMKPIKNFFILFDTRDGDGIEVWCSLINEDIALLEHDEEFLEFAAINPSIPY